jgi:hypothetical protein
MSVLDVQVRNLSIFQSISKFRNFEIPKLNQFFDILGKMLDEYLILSITFSNHTIFWLV